MSVGLREARQGLPERLRSPSLGSPVAGRLRPGLTRNRGWNSRSCPPQLPPWRRGVPEPPTFLGGIVRGHSERAAEGGRGPSPYRARRAGRAAPGSSHSSQSLIPALRAKRSRRRRVKDLGGSPEAARDARIPCNQLLNTGGSIDPAADNRDTGRILLRSRSPTAGVTQLHCHASAAGTVSSYGDTTRPPRLEHRTGAALPKGRRGGGVSLSKEAAPPPLSMYAP
eukprot:gene17446-biopygen8513